MSDWQWAWVIDAAVEMDDAGDRRRLRWNMPGEWVDDGGCIYDSRELSDVRVIVDAEGKVMPPPITDEMVERLAVWLFTHNRPGERWADCNQDAYRLDAGNALRAALGGADHG